jgi:SEC-C motif
MPRRNEVCPCGSGLKFKKCCLRPKPPKAEEPPAAEVTAPKTRTLGGFIVLSALGARKRGGFAR